jgi:hypothetical protein
MSVECNSQQEKVDVYRQSQQANQGASRLIHAVNWDNPTPDEAPNYASLNKVTFSTNGPKQCTKYDCNGSVAHTHKSTGFSQSNNGIPATWYLLQNQSTYEIVSNPKLVMNIRQVEGHMQLSTQAGSTTMSWMADVHGYYYRSVWFYPGGIANILSMVNVITKYHVTYDSQKGKNPNAFCVHKEDGVVWKFQQSTRGLYYLDTVDLQDNMVLVTTVADNKINLPIATTRVPN